MTRILPILAATGLLIVTGFAHGLWTGRWVASRDLQEAVARIETIPTTTGDWVGQPKAMDPREVEAAGIAGYLMRTYVNRTTGEELTALLVCGRPGPIAVHTPDICYAGAGYALADPPTRVAVEYPKAGAAGEFMGGNFVKEGPVASTRLRILWAWNAGGGWKAPENPRMAYAVKGALYKAYIVRQVSDASVTTKKEDTGVEFLRGWLPEVDEALFAGR